jgi:hypothetical protein
MSYSSKRMPICSVCGNESDPEDKLCHFCGTEVQTAASFSREARVHRLVNIERGRPLVETALKIMENELGRAASDGIRVVTLIHGYGSSGKGGRIRTECRAALEHLQREKKIQQMIPGEDFKRRSGAGKALLQRFPSLLKDCSSDFSNPGITLVVI